MYLNVNLTPPDPTAAEGSCTTPKTPEILNSLINLTSPPLPHSYPHHYQCEVNSGPLQSPVSDLSSPGDESAAGTFGSIYRKRGDARYMFESMGSYAGGGGGGLVGGSPGTSGMGGPLAGASPPSTPDLPSPVSTVEATKSALIKEGLKLQIRSKLHAAGVDAQESLLDDETKIFRDLTEEDEERRRRRRERNKVAATKCRNKKKEKTCYLVSESETVEDVNLRLKTEIQRLTSEKNKLEKLLCDPDHRAHCRHSGRCSTKSARPPLVIVTPAESPGTTTTASSPSSSSSASSTTSSSSLDSPTSPPLSCSLSYDLPTTVVPNITSQPLSSLSSLSMTTLLPGTTTSSSSDSVSCASSAPSQFLAPKYSPAQVINPRHHPYQFPGRSHQSAGVGGEQQGYASPASPPGCQTKPSYNYPCLGVPQTHEFVSPNLPSQKSMYATPKSRSGGHVRYNPYSTRPPPVTSPLATHTHPQPGTVACADSYVQPNTSTGCGREDQQVFVTDMHTNQFFPPCSYSNM